MNKKNQITIRQSCQLIDDILSIANYQDYSQLRLTAQTIRYMWVVYYGWSCATNCSYGSWKL